MLIGIQGVNGKNNGAVGIACSIAGFLALNRNRKTLILQFLNNTNKSAEKLLIGNRLRIEQGDFDEEETGFSDEGMDELLRRVEGSKLMDADFNRNCTPMNEKVNHLFDVANISTEEHLDEYLLERMEEEDNIVSRLIKSAAGNEKTEDVGVYSNVIFIIDSANKEFAKKINEFADYTIYCVPQGFADKNVKITDKKKEIIVVNNFDTESKFNIKTMKKEYSVRKIYPVVHNVGYKDALLAGTLLSFIKRNRECERDDKNYWWKQSIADIITFISGKEEPEERLTTKELAKDQPKKTLNELDIEECEEEVVMPKRKMFRPKPKPIKVGIAKRKNETMEE